MTAFRDYLSVCEELIGREPEILEMVNSDLNRKAKNEKKNRLEDNEWEKRYTKIFPWAKKTRVKPRKQNMVTD